MKRISTLLLALLVLLPLQAQKRKALEASKFLDNWSIGLVGGGMVKTTHADLPDDVRAVYGAELTKQLTPQFSLGFQFVGSNNLTESRTVFDASNLSLLGRINLSNLFAGYYARPRLFEIEAVCGVGWGHLYSTEKNDRNFLTTKYGLDLNFNLGQKRAWTIGLKPAIVYNMNTPEASVTPSYNVNKSMVELMAGVTYHFKNSNGAHHFTLHRGYDQAEVDALNAKVNDLRSRVNDRDAEVARQQEEIARLQAVNADLRQQLTDCQGRKPVVETHTVTKHSASLEQTVTFRQGKSTVDPSQQPNVERVATFLKNHPEATVSIKGYASPEGSAEINAKIAKARAEAVKTILVNKYHIAPARIEAEGQGVGNMFSEDDWNRVSICTIHEGE